MKNQKNKKRREHSRESVTRDIVLANKVSRSIHGGISKIRLSLAFRIAWHYCVQLIRSYIPVALILTVSIFIAASIPVQNAIDRMISSGYEMIQSTASPGYLTIQPAEEIIENDFFPRIRQQLTVVFSDLLNQEQIRFYYSMNDENWLVSLDLHDLRIIWIVLMAALMIGDLFRMIYFFRHDQRLNKRVLSPIREIASMAETLSESNLSNRINIAGTKNELKDLAVVINRMLDRIEKSYNSQKQFVSDASHELRTPISVIRGYTDMLKRWGKDDPDVLDEGIEAISQETEGMKDLVESLLFLARHDKKTLMMEVSPFNPSDLIRDILKEEIMVHADHRFAIGKADQMTIMADRNMIKQVLRILCDNAVKYSDPETTITLSCVENQDGDCCLAVQDMGQGIPAEELPKIFDRFYRSDKARKSDSGGHGLGLSIARIIVIAHKGKIKVKSKPGVGTEFLVLLPGN